MSERRPWETDELEQRAREAGAAFAEFVKTVAALRHPEHGCPWDLKQTHQSLRKYMIEEAYEAAEAMLSGDHSHLLEELGDVLLQVVLHAELATNNGRGSIKEIIDGINDKMLRRHPHVFDDEYKNSLGGSPDEALIKKKWQEIKAAEKPEQMQYKSHFDEKKLPGFPASLQAEAIGKLAKTIGFDWSEPSQVIEQVRSELDELESELEQIQPDRSAIEAEMADVFFSAYQLSRHLGLDPEACAQLGNVKFRHRFAKVEALAADRSINISSETPTAVLEALWQEAKKLN